MMPLGEYGSPFDELTDEEKQALVAQYAPAAPSLGPVTRAGGGAMPSPMRPPPSAMPSMESSPVTPRTPGGVDPDLMRRFAEAQQQGAGNASFARLGNRLRNAGRLYAGLPEVADDSASLRNRPVSELMQMEGVKQQQRALTRQYEMDGVNLAKTRAETTRAEAQATSTAEEAAREAALGSLDSPETQAERRATAALLAKNPNVTPELLNSLNGLQLRNLSLRGGQQINAEAMAGMRQSQLDMTAEQQAFQRQMERWRMGLDRERLDQDWDKFEKTQEQARELEELRNAARVAASGRERDAKMEEREVGGFKFAEGRTPSADNAKKMTEAAIASRKIQRGIGRLKSLYAQHGTELFGEYAGEAESEFTALTTALRVMNDMGVPNGRDYEFLAKELADPTTWRDLFTTTGRNMSKLDTLGRRVADTVEITGEALGYVPIVAPSREGTASNPSRGKTKTEPLPAPKVGSRANPAPPNTQGTEPSPADSGIVPMPETGPKPRNVGLKPFTKSIKAEPRAGQFLMFNPKGAQFYVPEANVAKARERGWKDAQ